MNTLSMWHRSTLSHTSSQGLGITAGHVIVEMGSRVTAAFSIVTLGVAWCNGQYVCFPSLPPMLLCGFESRLVA